jgi:hypothetical protein
MNVFRQEGEYWTIVYDGVTCRLRDTRGLQILAVLLRRPGERVGSAELLVQAQSQDARTGGRRDPGDGTALPSESRAQERARVRATRAIKAALLKLTGRLPALADHFAATVRTGHRCAYLPDPRVRITWNTDGPSSDTRNP